jgi:ubiquinone/menaquinone biosynthesis C-methylase UbiE
MNAGHESLSIEELKRKQIRHQSDSLGSLTGVVYEQDVHHDHFRAIPFAKTATLLEQQGVDLNGKTVLVTSCGTGIDVHYLRKYYPRAVFSVCDLSDVAVAIASSSLKVAGSTEDSERLGHADRAFDYCFVAASLHHLPRPWIGLYEMIRVSRCGVIVIEPNDSPLTRLATALGLATRVEPSGNYVFRFGKHDVEKIAASLFLSCATSRYFAVHRVAGSRIEFVFLKMLNRLANLVAPSQGNYISFVVLKDSGPAC